MTKPTPRIQVHPLVPSPNRPGICSICQLGEEWHSHVYVPGENGEKGTAVAIEKERK